MENLWSWGINLILHLQTFEGWRLPMQLITFTGSTEFFLLILPTLYWLGNRRLGVRMATLLLAGIALGNMFKLAAHGPRPYWIDARVQLLVGEEATFGLPSVHAINAMVMWPLLARYLERAWAWLVALLLILLAGVARVYLGVHFPSDVIGGWLLGASLLLLWWFCSDAIGGWFATRTPSQQAMFAAIVSVVIVLLGALVRLAVATWWDPFVGWPALWPQEGERLLLAFSLGDIVTAAAVFAGMVVGLLFCQRQGSFATDGSGIQLVARYLLGVIGVLMFWKGLDLLFALLAQDESSLGYALRYIRYSLVGFWIFGLAPLLFVKLRLAQREMRSTPTP